MVAMLTAVALGLIGVHASESGALGAPPSSVSGTPFLNGEACGWRTQGIRVGFTLPGGNGTLHGTPTGGQVATLMVDQDRTNLTFQVLDAKLNGFRAYVSDVTGETGGQYSLWDHMPFTLSGASPILDVSSRGNFTSLTACLVPTVQHLTVTSTVDAGPGGTFSYRVGCNTADDGNPFASGGFDIPTTVSWPGTFTVDVPDSVYCLVRTSTVPAGYVPDADHLLGSFLLPHLQVIGATVMHNQFGTFDLEVRTETTASIAAGTIVYAFRVSVTNLGTVGFTPNPEIDGQAFIPVLIATPTDLLMPDQSQGKVVSVSPNLARWEIPSIAAGETRTMSSNAAPYPVRNTYVPGVDDVCAGISYPWVAFPNILSVNFSRLPPESSLDNNSNCAWVTP